MKINENRFGLYFSVLIGVGLMLFLTYDIIITNILSAYYCSTAPNPKTKIIKKVEYPESIYWEDNVYPGFSKQDRELMIKNYLDGVHLKTMALNGADGKHIYVYTREVPKQEYMAISHTISSISQEIKRMQAISKERQDKQYIKDINKLYRDRESLQAKQAKLINSYPVSEKVYTKQTMPTTNYTVTFNEVKLNSFARKFLYSDETKVIENNTSRVIAYNRRYMRFFYKLLPDVALGNIYYYPHALCGESYFWFTHRVFNYKPIEVTSNHKDGLNNYLYKKYIKGEK
jgi:hypothetical protein